MSKRASQNNETAKSQAPNYNQFLSEQTRHSKLDGLWLVKRTGRQKWNGFKGHLDGIDEMEGGRFLVALGNNTTGGQTTQPGRNAIDTT